MNNTNNINREIAQLVVEAVDGDAGSKKALQDKLGIEEAQREMDVQLSVRETLQSFDLPMSHGLATDIARLDEATVSNTELRLIQKSRTRSAKWMTGIVASVAATIAFVVFSNIQHQERVDMAAKEYQYALGRVSAIAAKGESVVQSRLHKSVQSPMSKLSKSSFFQQIVFPQNRRNSQ